MNRIILTTFLSFIMYSSVFAQLTPEQRIQDSVVGWWSNNKFDHLKPQTDPVGKKKEVHVNKMLEWMKKSYTPVAGLGTSSRYIDKMGYGVLCYVWNVSHKKEWTEPNGNFVPISEENTPFWIAANRVFGSFTIPLFQKTNEYYFTMQPDGYGDNDQALNNRKSGDPGIHPNAYKYLTWINDWQTVYLTPNNKLPFIAITKGQLLQQAEESLDKQLADELKDVQAKWPDNKKTQEEVMLIRKQNIEKYRTNIQKLRELHKNNLNEPAVIRDMQPTMYSFQLDPDIFKIDNHEKELKHYYQVYKVDAELYAKMQSDTPQWIAISFPYETKESGNQLYEMYTALSQNFNYDYAYNYFFDPGKLKGIPYAPANETQLKARLDNYRKKNNAPVKLVSANTPMVANAYFFDDFSGNADGSNPAGWIFSTSGKHSVITSLKNNPGKWVRLGYNNPFSSTIIKKPLPENFILEFDVATDGDFSSPTGGATSLVLNTRSSNKDGSENIYNNGTRVSIDVVSGNEAGYENNNYSGNIKIEIHSAPSVNKQNSSEGIFYTCSLREFTDKKTKLHVAVKVNSAILTVFVNNKQVAVSTDFKMTYGGDCISCELPAGTRFNSIFWKNTTSDNENVNVYISNIKITKD